MNIHVVFQNVIDNKLMTSIENKSLLEPNQTVFQSKFSLNDLMFDVKNVSCTEAVFKTVLGLANTLQAPILIDSGTANKTLDRINVYIENGSLKIA